MTSSSLSVKTERWPIAGGFAISRGAKTAADVVVARLQDGDSVGRGECVPYGRYGETLHDVVAQIEAMTSFVAGGGGAEQLQAEMPAGAARNALDCALWDLAAKRAGVTVAQLAGLPQPHPKQTAFTISLADAKEMAKKAAAVPAYPLLKLKLGVAGDAARLRAVRAARPDARLIVDANEGWAPADLAQMLEVCAATEVELVEQPLPQGEDGFLADIPHPVLLCADESAHGSADVAALAGRYDAVNIKLDKTGGLTDALHMVKTAKAHDLKIMTGCMVATSLAMAPAMLIAQMADYVDLDGPLLLEQDRPDGLKYDGATIYPPDQLLWG